MTKFYTGVGSRETPLEIQHIMTALAHKLGQDGWILRTGDASGADASFRQGATKAEVYTVKSLNSLAPRIRDMVVEDFFSVHPTPHRCSPYAQALLQRDSLELKGQSYDTPSRFVVCWTPQAKPVGGTGHTIRLAHKFGIEVFNLANQEHLNRIIRYINS